MKYAGILVFVVLLSCKSKETEKTTLLAPEAIVMAAPLFECENLFFTDSVEVTMKFSLPDSKIKYTLDETEVVQASNDYNQPIRLYETTVVRAKNFHPEFQSDNDSRLKVVRTNTKLKGSKIQIVPEPNERYQGNGASSLSDHIKGTTAFANGDAWLGFQTDSVFLNIDFLEGQAISKVTVSTIANHGAWIFLPKQITVFSGKQEVGKVDLKKPLEVDNTRLEFIEIPIKKNTYSNLRIVVSSVNKIPEWHQGKGTVAWFFVDEILVE